MRPMPSSLLSRTSETARLTSAMSSRVTPASRSTTTRTTLRRPAGVTTSSSRSYPARRPRARSSRPAARWRGPAAGDRESGHGFLLQTRAAAPDGAGTPSAPAPTGRRRWRIRDRGERPGYRPAGRAETTVRRRSPAPTWYGRGARDTRWAGRERGTRLTRRTRPRAVRLRGWGRCLPSRPPPAGFLPAHPARRLRGRGGAAGRRMHVAPAGRAGAVTSEQADELAAQVGVQEALVAAFAAASRPTPPWARP